MNSRSILDSLTTRRLVLAPVNESDTSWLQTLMEKPDVNKNTLVVPTPCPQGFASEWVATAIENNRSGKTLTFAVRKGRTLQPIGGIFLIVNATHAHAELGYFFDPASWNNGYCTEAAREVLRFAFQRLALNRVFAVHFSSNPASGRVMSKIGMKYEGCRRKHVRKRNVFLDLEQYGVLRDEWSAVEGS